MIISSAIMFKFEQHIYVCVCVRESYLHVGIYINSKYLILCQHSPIQKNCINELGMRLIAVRPNELTYAQVCSMLCEAN